MRNLILLLHDQLLEHPVLFDGFDRHRDAVWIVGAGAKSPFERELTAKGYCVLYVRVADVANLDLVAVELMRTLGRFRPQRLLMLESVVAQLKSAIAAAAIAARCELHVLP